MAADPDFSATPNTIPWPPIVLAGTALAAVLLGHWLKLGRVLPPGILSWGPGGAVMLAGAGLDLAAIRAMRRSRANILPHRAATALVTQGVFAVSRNPIYLGNSLLLAGAGLTFGNAWLLIAAIAAARLVTTLAIEREEAHLAARFGEAWTAYAARTPRWLRLRR